MPAPATILLLGALCAAAPATNDEPVPPLTAVDYLAPVGMGAVVLALTLLVPEPPNGWKRGLLFDDEVLELGTVTNPGARDDLSTISDYLQNGLILAPFVMDVGATALLAEKNPTLAWRMFWMDVQAMLVSSLVVVVTKRTIGRVRPDANPCPGTTDDYSCASNTSRRSFISGHASASFAGAGLVCAHHDFLELWGGPSDTAACVTALGLAVTASALRVPSARHYATDVLAGAASGLFAGYAVPYLLHLAGDRYAPKERITGAFTVYATGGGATFAGDTAPAVGIDAAMAHRHWFRPGLALALGVDGRVFESGTSLRQVTPWLGAWYHHFGASFVVDYHSAVRDEVAENELVAGVQLAAGVLHDTNPIVVSARWLPLFDGSPDHFLARVDAAFAAHFALRAEVQTLFERDATFTLGLGGRLPW